MEKQKLCVTELQNVKVWTLTFMVAYRQKQRPGYKVNYNLRWRNCHSPGLLLFIGGCLVILGGGTILATTGGQIECNNTMSV